MAGNSHLKFSAFMRFVAAFVLTAFVSTNVQALPVQERPAAPHVTASGSFPADLRQIRVPADSGKIQEIYQGKSREVVVLVQDAHAIPEAQRSIQKLIGNFQKENGLKLVGVEGAASALDPQIFRSFPDPKLLKKTFDAYLENGELTGTTAAAIFNETPATYQGIENWNLYEQGLALYLKASANGETLAAKIAGLKADLQKRKETVYSKALLDLDQALEKFHSDQAGLAETLEKLVSVRAPEKGSELALLTEELFRKDRETGSVDLEVKKLAGEARLKIPNKALAEFNAKNQQFLTGVLGAAEFALWLKEQIPSLAFSERLAGLAGKQKKLHDIEGTQLFSDLEKYEKDAKESLFKNGEERGLDRESRKLELMGRLASLELSRADWSEIRTMGTAPLEKDFNNHFAFYENAVKRDEALFGNLINAMKKQKAASALLVAGGFHTTGFTQRLREQGISYLLLMPQIGALPEQNHYREHMRGEVSWKSYFKVENGKVSLRDAFVRAARDKLLDQPETLKLWRDQVIRDLVEKEKAANVSNYTGFLDEVAAKQTRQPWEDKLDTLLKNLRALDAAGQLNQQNIVNLLQKTTVADVVTADALAGDLADAKVVFPSLVLSESRSLPQLRVEVRTGIGVPAQQAPGSGRSEARAQVTKTVKYGEKASVEISGGRYEIFVTSNPEDELRPLVYFAAEGDKNAPAAQPLAVKGVLTAGDTRLVMDRHFPAKKSILFRIIRAEARAMTDALAKRQIAAAGEMTTEEAVLLMLQQKREGAPYTNGFTSPDLKEMGFGDTAAFLREGLKNRLFTYDPRGRAPDYGVRYKPFDTHYLAAAATSILGPFYEMQALLVALINAREGRMTIQQAADTAKLDYQKARTLMQLAHRLGYLKEVGTGRPVLGTTLYYLFTGKGRAFAKRHSGERSGRTPVSPALRGELDVRRSEVRMANQERLNDFRALENDLIAMLPKLEPGWEDRENQLENGDLDLNDLEPWKLYLKHKNYTEFLYNLIILLVDLQETLKKTGSEDVLKESVGNITALLRMLERAVFDDKTLPGHKDLSEELRKARAKIEGDNEVYEALSLLDYGFDETAQRLGDLLAWFRVTSDSSFGKQFHLKEKTELAAAFDSLEEMPEHPGALPRLQALLWLRALWVIWQEYSPDSAHQTLENDFAEIKNLERLLGPEAALVAEEFHSLARRYAEKLRDPKRRSQIMDAHQLRLSLRSILEDADQVPVAASEPKDLLRIRAMERKGLVDSQRWGKVLTYEFSWGQKTTGLTFFDFNRKELPVVATGSLNASSIGAFYGQYLIAAKGSDIGIWHWRINNNKLLFRKTAILSESSRILASAFSNDGKLIAIMFRNQTSGVQLALFDIHGVQRWAQPVLQAEWEIDEIVFSPDNRKLALRQIGALDIGRVSFWDVDSGKQAVPTVLTENTVSEFSPDWKYMAWRSVDDAQTMHLRNLAIGQDYEFSIKEEINEVRFSLDGRLAAFVSINDQKKVYTWALNRMMIPDFGSIKPGVRSGPRRSEARSSDLTDDGDNAAEKEFVEEYRGPNFRDRIARLSADLLNEVRFLTEIAEKDILRTQAQRLDHILLDDSRIDQHATAQLLFNIAQSLPNKRALDSLRESLIREALGRQIFEVRYRLRVWINHPLMERYELLEQSLGALVYFESRGRKNFDDIEQARLKKAEEKGVFDRQAVLLEGVDKSGKIVHFKGPIAVRDGALQELLERVRKFRDVLPQDYRARYAVYLDPQFREILIGKIWGEKYPNLRTATGNALIVEAADILEIARKIGTLRSEARHELRSSHGLAPLGANRSESRSLSSRVDLAAQQAAEDEVQAVLADVLAKSKTSYLDHDPVYEALISRLSPEAAKTKIRIDFSTRELTQKTGDEMIAEVAAQLGEAYVALLVEPAISLRFNQFLEFALKAKSEGVLPAPLELRKQFIASFPVRRIYRALRPQSDEDLKKLRQNGFVAGFFKTTDAEDLQRPVFPSDRLAPKIFDFSARASVHRERDDTDNSHLISVTPYQRMAATVALHYYRHVGSGEIQLFPIEINDFYLLPLRHPPGEMSLGKTHVPMLTDSEPFAEFRIPPQYIKFDEARLLDKTEVEKAAAVADYQKDVDLLKLASLDRAKPASELEQFLETFRAGFKGNEADFYVEAIKGFYAVRIARSGQLNRHWMVDFFQAGIPLANIIQACIELGLKDKELFSGLYTLAFNFNPAVFSGEKKSFAFEDLDAGVLRILEEKDKAASFRSWLEQHALAGESEAPEKTVPAGLVESGLTVPDYSAGEQQNLLRQPFWLDWGNPVPPQARSLMEAAHKIFRRNIPEAKVKITITRRPVLVGNRLHLSFELRISSPDAESLEPFKGLEIAFRNKETGQVYRTTFKLYQEEVRSPGTLMATEVGGGEYRSYLYADTRTPHPFEETLGKNFELWIPAGLQQYIRSEARSDEQTVHGTTEFEKPGPEAGADAETQKRNANVAFEGKRIIFIEPSELLEILSGKKTISGLDDLGRRALAAYTLQGLDLDQTAALVSTPARPLTVSAIGPLLSRRRAQIAKYFAWRLDVPQDQAQKEVTDILAEFRGQGADWPGSYRQWYAKYVKWLLGAEEQPEPLDFSFNFERPQMIRRLLEVMLPSYGLNHGDRGKITFKSHPVWGRLALIHDSNGKTLATYVVSDANFRPLIPLSAGAVRKTARAQGVYELRKMIYGNEGPFDLQTLFDFHDEQSDEYYSTPRITGVGNNNGQRFVVLMRDNRFTLPSTYTEDTVGFRYLPGAVYDSESGLHPFVFLNTASESAGPVAFLNMYRSGTEIKSLLEFAENRKIETNSEHVNFTSLLIKYFSGEAPFPPRPRILNAIKLSVGHGLFIGSAFYINNSDPGELRVRAMVNDHQEKLLVVTSPDRKVFYGAWRFTSDKKWRRVMARSTAPSGDGSIEPAEPAGTGSSEARAVKYGRETPGELERSLPWWGLLLFAGFLLGVATLIAWKVVTSLEKPQTVVETPEQALLKRLLALDANLAKYPAYRDKFWGDWTADLENSESLLREIEETHRNLTDTKLGFSSSRIAAVTNDAAILREAMKSLKARINKLDLERLLPGLERLRDISRADWKKINKETGEEEYTVLGSAVINGVDLMLIVTRARNPKNGETHYRIAEYRNGEIIRRRSAEFREPEQVQAIEAALARSGIRYRSEARSGEVDPNLATLPQLQAVVKAAGIGRNNIETVALAIFREAAAKGLMNKTAVRDLLRPLFDSLRLGKNSPLIGKVAASFKYPDFAPQVENWDSKLRLFLARRGFGEKAYKAISANDLVLFRGVLNPELKDRIKWLARALEVPLDAAALDRLVVDLKKEGWLRDPAKKDSQDVLQPALEGIGAVKDEAAFRQFLNGVRRVLETHLAGSQEKYKYSALLRFVQPAGFTDGQRQMINTVMDRVFSSFGVQARDDWKQLLREATAFTSLEAAFERVKDLLLQTSGMPLPQTFSAPQFLFARTFAETINGISQGEAIVLNMTPPGQQQSMLFMVGISNFDKRGRNRSDISFSGHAAHEYAEWIVGKLNPGLNRDRSGGNFLSDWIGRSMEIVMEDWLARDLHADPSVWYGPIGNTGETVTRWIYNEGRRTAREELPANWAARLQSYDFPENTLRYDQGTFLGGVAREIGEKIANAPANAGRYDAMERAAAFVARLGTLLYYGSLDELGPLAERFLAENGVESGRAETRSDESQKIQPGSRMTEQKRIVINPFDLCVWATLLLGIGILIGFWFRHVMLSGSRPADLKGDSGRINLDLYKGLKKNREIRLLLLERKGLMQKLTPDRRIGKDELLPLFNTLNEEAEVSWGVFNEWRKSFEQNQNKDSDAVDEAILKIAYMLSDDSAAWSHVLNALGKLKTDGSEEELLEKEDRYRRYLDEMADFLNSHWDDSISHWVQRLLVSGNLNDRRLAVDLLDRLRNSKSISLLIHLLQKVNEENGIRVRAAQIMAGLSHSELPPQFVKEMAGLLDEDLLHENQPVYPDIIRALGKTGNSAIATPLIGLLKRTKHQYEDDIAGAFQNIAGTVDPLAALLPLADVDLRLAVVAVLAQSPEAILASNALTRWQDHFENDPTVNKVILKALKILEGRIARMASQPFDRNLGASGIGRSEARSAVVAAADLEAEVNREIEAGLVSALPSGAKILALYSSSFGQLLRLHEFTLDEQSVDPQGRAIVGSLRTLGPAVWSTDGQYKVIALSNPTMPVGSVTIERVSSPYVFSPSRSEVRSLEEEYGKALETGEGLLDVVIGYYSDRYEVKDREKLGRFVSTYFKDKKLTWTIFTLDLDAMSSALVMNGALVSKTGESEAERIQTLQLTRAGPANAKPAPASSSAPSWSKRHPTFMGLLLLATAAVLAAVIIFAVLPATRSFFKPDARVLVTDLTDTEIRNISIEEGTGTVFFRLLGGTTGGLSNGDGAFVQGGILSYVPGQQRWAGEGSREIQTLLQPYQKADVKRVRIMVRAEALKPGETAEFKLEMRGFWRGKKTIKLTGPKWHQVDINLDKNDERPYFGISDYTGSGDVQLAGLRFLRSEVRAGTNEEEDSNFESPETVAPGHNERPPATQPGQVDETLVRATARPATPAEKTKENKVQSRDLVLGRAYPPFSFFNPVKIFVFLVYWAIWILRGATWIFRISPATVIKLAEDQQIEFTVPNDKFPAMGETFLITYRESKLEVRKRVGTKRYERVDPQDWADQSVKIEYLKDGEQLRLTNGTDSSIHVSLRPSVRYEARSAADATERSEARSAEKITVFLEALKETPVILFISGHKQKTLRGKVEKIIEVFGTKRPVLIAIRATSKNAAVQMDAIKNLRRQYKDNPQVWIGAEAVFKDAEALNHENETIDALKEADPRFIITHFSKPELAHAGWDNGIPVFIGAPALSDLAEVARSGTGAIVYRPSSGEKPSQKQIRAFAAKTFNKPLIVGGKLEFNQIADFLKEPNVVAVGLGRNVEEGNFEENLKQLKAELKRIRKKVRKSEKKARKKVEQIEKKEARRSTGRSESRTGTDVPAQQAPGAGRSEARSENLWYETIDWQKALQDSNILPQLQTRRIEASEVINALRRAFEQHGQPFRDARELTGFLRAQNINGIGTKALPKWLAEAVFAQRPAVQSVVTAPPPVPEPAKVDEPSLISGDVPLALFLRALGIEIHIPESAAQEGFWIADFTLPDAQLKIFNNRVMPAYRINGKAAALRIVFQNKNPVLLIADGVNSDKIPSTLVPRDQIKHTPYALVYAATPLMGRTRQENLNEIQAFKDTVAWLRASGQLRSSEIAQNHNKPFHSYVRYLAGTESESTIVVMESVFPPLDETSLILEGLLGVLVPFKQNEKILSLGGGSGSSTVGALRRRGRQGLNLAFLETDTNPVAIPNILLNARRYGFGSQVRAVQADLFDLPVSAAAPDEKFDRITMSLPVEVEKAPSRHSDAIDMALWDVGGKLYNRVIKEANSRLAENGALELMLNLQMNSLARLLEEGWEPAAVGGIQTMRSMPKIPFNGVGIFYGLYALKRQKDSQSRAAEIARYIADLKAMDALLNKTERTHRFHPEDLTALAQMLKRYESDSGFTARLIYSLVWETFAVKFATYEPLQILLGRTRISQPFTDHEDLAYNPIYFPQRPQMPSWFGEQLKGDGVEKMLGKQEDEASAPAPEVYVFKKDQQIIDKKAPFGGEATYIVITGNADGSVVAYNAADASRRETTFTAVQLSDTFRFKYTRSESRAFNFFKPWELDKESLAAQINFLKNSKMVLDRIFMFGLAAFFIHHVRNETPYEQMRPLFYGFFTGLGFLAINHWINIIRGRGGLVASGHYYFTQNPIYLAYITAFAAFFILTPTLLNFAFSGFAILAILYWTVRERTSTYMALGTPYAEYASNTPFLLPFPLAKILGRTVTPSVKEGARKAVLAEDQTAKPWAPKSPLMRVLFHWLMTLLTTALFGYGIYMTVDLEIRATKLKQIEDLKQEIEKIRRAGRSGRTPMSPALRGELDVRRSESRASQSERWNNAADALEAAIMSASVQNPALRQLADDLLLIKDSEGFKTDGTLLYPNPVAAETPEFFDTRRKQIAALEKLIYAGRRDDFSTQIGSIVMQMPSLRRDLRDWDRWVRVAKAFLMLKAAFANSDPANEPPLMTLARKFFEALPTDTVNTGLDPRETRPVFSRSRMLLSLEWLVQFLQALPVTYDQVKNKRGAFFDEQIRAALPPLQPVRISAKNLQDSKEELDFSVGFPVYLVNGALTSHIFLEMTPSGELRVRSDIADHEAYSQNRREQTLRAGEPEIAVVVDAKTGMSVRIEYSQEGMISISAGTSETLYVPLRQAALFFNSTAFISRDIRVDSGESREADNIPDHLVLRWAGKDFDHRVDLVLIRSMMSERKFFYKVYVDLEKAPAESSDEERRAAFAGDWVLPFGDQPGRLGEFADPAAYFEEFGNDGVKAVLEKLRRKIMENGGSMTKANSALQPFEAQWQRSIESKLGLTAKRALELQRILRFIAQLTEHLEAYAPGSKTLIEEYLPELERLRPDVNAGNDPAGDSILQVTNATLVNYLMDDVVYNLEAFNGILLRDHPRETVALRAKMQTVIEQIKTFYEEFAKNYRHTALVFYGSPEEITLGDVTYEVLVAPNPANQKEPLVTFARKGEPNKPSPVPLPVYNPEDRATHKFLKVHGAKIRITKHNPSTRSVTLEYTRSESRTAARALPKRPAAEGPLRDLYDDLINRYIEVAAFYTKDHPDMERIQNRFWKLFTFGEQLQRAIKAGKINERSFRHYVDTLVHPLLRATPEQINAFLVEKSAATHAYYWRALLNTAAKVDAGEDPQNFRPDYFIEIIDRMLPEMERPGIHVENVAGEQQVTTLEPARIPNPWETVSGFYAGNLPVLFYAVSRKEKQALERMEMLMPQAFALLAKIGLEPLVQNLGRLEIIELSQLYDHDTPYEIAASLVLLAARNQAENSGEVLAGKEGQLPVMAFNEVLLANPYRDVASSKSYMISEPGSYTPDIVLRRLQARTAYVQAVLRLWQQTDFNRVSSINILRRIEASQRFAQAAIPFLEQQAALFNAQANAVVQELKTVWSSELSAAALQPFLTLPQEGSPRQELRAFGKIFPETPALGIDYESVLALAGSGVPESLFDLLDPGYVAHDRAVRELVNPEGKPLVGLYGGSGVDVSNAFISTDAEKIYFIDKYLPSLSDLKQLLSLWNTAGFMNLKYLHFKRIAGYGAGSEDQGLSDAEPHFALLAELKKMGVKPESLKFYEENGNPVLEFEWAYFGAGPRTRKIVFVPGDITRPQGYSWSLYKLFQGQFDFYYQRAGLNISWKIGGWYPYVLHSIRTDGHLIMDNYSIDPFMKIERVLPAERSVGGHITPVTSPKLGAIAELVRRRRPTLHEEINFKDVLNYGFNVSIYRVVSPIGQEDDEVARAKRSELRASMGPGDENLQPQVQRMARIVNALAGAVLDWVERYEEHHTEIHDMEIPDLLWNVVESAFQTAGLGIVESDELSTAVHDYNADSRFRFDLEVDEPYSIIIRVRNEARAAVPAADLEREINRALDDDLVNAKPAAAPTTFVSVVFNTAPSMTINWILATFDLSVHIASPQGGAILQALQGHPDWDDKASYTVLVQHVPDPHSPIALVSIEKSGSAGAGNRAETRASVGRPVQPPAPQEDPDLHILNMFASQRAETTQPFDEIQSFIAIMLGFNDEDDVRGFIAEYNSSAQFRFTFVSVNDGAEYQIVARPETRATVPADFEKSVQLDRSELRRGLIETLIPALMGRIKLSLAAMTALAALILTFGVPATEVEALEAAVMVRAQESVRTEREAGSIVEAVRSAKTVYVDYVVSDRELNQPGAVEALIENARNINGTNPNVMGRFIFPENSRGKIKLPKDRKRGDQVRLEVSRNEVRVYTPGVKGADQLGLVPATVTVTGAQIAGADQLLTDELGDRQALPSGVRTAASLYTAAVLSVTAKPDLVAELLKQVREAQGKKSWRIQNQGVFSALESATRRLGELFRSEQRIKQAA